VATISSPGIGSSLDVNSIVSQLMVAESQPLTQLQTREASYQAKLTAYSSVKGSLSSFQTAVAALSDPSLFQSLTGTSSNTSVLSASTTSTAVPGSYAITVNTLAQAQSISSAGEASTATAIGSGTATTLTFQFGTISGGSLSNGQYTGSTFTQNASQATGTVVIDSTNNSLQGIRDAINSANIGVTASIVNDGDPNTPYHLLLTSKSTGQAESMKITSSGGDSAITSLLSYDPASTQNLTQTTAAQNASLSVNGLPITSTTNTVTGAISGVTLNLTQGGGATTTLSVANNTAAVTTAINNLVQAYNSVNTVLSSYTRYDSSTQTAGPLFGDATIQQIQARIRSTLTGTLAGVGSNTLTNITQIGLEFQKDGSLTVDSSTLQTALTNNFSNFAQLFSNFGETTDSLVNYVSSTSSSQAGSYSVNVTSLATQGKSVGSNAATQAMLTGSTTAGLTITSGSNDQLQVAVDGGSPITVTLTPGTYTDAASLATQVQSDINSALTAAGQTGQVTVTQNGGKISINSNTFGSSSAISVTSVSGNTGASNLLGSSPTNSTATTITAGVNDQLTIGANGTSATITLAPGTYTAADLASQIQSAFNSSSAFTSAGVSIGVSQSNGVLTVTSSKYGLSSAVTIAGGNAMTDLFGTPTATIGTDVAGTINGVTATGSGQYLMGATGDASEGIRVQIVGGTTGSRGTINFSQGYAYNLNNLLNNYLSDNGTIANDVQGVNNTITDIQNQQSDWKTRLADIQQRYLSQFTALDTLMSQLTTTSTYLTQQLNSTKSSGN
jgi:flagellar hook-associated protein 2